MKKLKKVLRIIGLVMFLALAITGMSATGVAQLPPKRRGRDSDSEILIELVEKETQGDEAFY